MPATHEIDPELEAERSVRLFEKMFAKFQRTDALVLDATEGTAATGSGYVKLRLELPDRKRVFAYWFEWSRDTAPNPDGDCRIIRGVEHADELIGKYVHLVYTVNHKGFMAVEALMLRPKKKTTTSKKKTSGEAAEVP
jgi:hypothetical protein